MNDDNCKCVYIGRNADGSAFCGTSPSSGFLYEPCGDQPSYERFTNGEFRKQSVRLLPILLDLPISWFPNPLGTAARCFVPFVHRVHLVLNVFTYSCCSP
jgi:hypothetical protein